MSSNSFGEGCFETVRRLSDKSGNALVVNNYLKGVPLPTLLGQDSSYSAWIKVSSYNFY